MNQELKAMYEKMGISPEVCQFTDDILEDLRERFSVIDETAEYNQLKVLRAMQKHQVSEACLLGTTGYGYNDLGRDTLEEVYASVFHTESALVRPQITCGTHALALALMSNLRPGDELLSPVGKPYDTLEEVIGIRPSKGSLKEYGISYRQVDLLPDGSFDYDKIKHQRKDPSCDYPAFQGLSDPSDPVRKTHRRADCVYQGHQAGCYLHGGQLLRGICRKMRAQRCWCRHGGGFLN